MQVSQADSRPDNQRAHSISRQSGPPEQDSNAAPYADCEGESQVLCWVTCLHSPPVPQQSPHAPTSQAGYLPAETPDPERLARVRKLVISNGQMTVPLGKVRYCSEMCTFQHG
jgi:hypothetical protein